MDEQQARAILDPEVFKGDGSLYSLAWYLSWNRGSKDACLDGKFTADELEVIAWWMRHKS